MSLACQKNSYLSELVSKVQSCEPATVSTVIEGKKQKLNGFCVILDDSVLFPEGGGQPDDRGTINDVAVLRVSRKGADAVHFVPTPFDKDQEVVLKVDWKRRWDHMQQHSGQHLITAIADNEFGYATTSWNLGDKLCTIELDTPSITPSQIDQLECLVNEKIAAGIRMFPTLYETKDAPELHAVRTRGLPDDHEGAVRIVTIDGIDTNMCCGTHVSNLSHLQAIKILGSEKGKKGKINLLFIAGNRLLDYAAKCWQQEKDLTALLKGPPEKHVELVSKVQNAAKLAQKNQLMLLRDVAKLEVEKFKSNPQPMLSLHRKEGDNEFMNTIVNDINDPSVLIFITTGDDKGVGLYMLASTETAVEELGPKIALILEGKGASKRGRHQGRANKLQRRPQVEKMLTEYLSENGTLT